MVFPLIVIFFKYPSPVLWSMSLRNVSLKVKQWKRLNSTNFASKAKRRLPVPVTFNLYTEYRTEGGVIYIEYAYSAQISTVKTQQLIFIIDILTLDRVLLKLRIVFIMYVNRVWFVVGVQTAVIPCANTVLTVCVCLWHLRVNIRVALLKLTLHQLSQGNKLPLMCNMKKIHQIYSFQSLPSVAIQNNSSVSN